jgi:DNA-binding transcriptional LysR family regulator
MDTRQLAAFCAVVERRSFSRAATALGVTQPAVSLQMRTLEERLGQRLLDRSGRRVEPTEAGRRLYEHAVRVLAAERDLEDAMAAGSGGELGGRLAIGASTGPGAWLVPVLLCEFAALHPRVAVALTVSDTHTVIDQVAERRIELGVVGAPRRARALSFETLVRDEIVLAVPAGHRFAGQRVAPEDLAGETLVVMQEGAGVRQVVENELRRARIRLPGARLELGLQESVRAAVLAGHGVGFISRTAIEGDIAAGSLGMARVAGLAPARDIHLVRAAGRALSSAAEAFVEHARRSASVRPTA